MLPIWPLVGTLLLLETSELVISSSNLKQVSHLNHNKRVRLKRWTTSKGGGDVGHLFELRKQPSASEMNNNGNIYSSDTNTTPSIATQDDDTNDDELGATHRQEPASSGADTQAELCYLADGRSSLALTVNEATQVGAIVGTLNVNGEPALEGGNVDLVDGIVQAAAGSELQPTSVAAAPFYSLVGGAATSSSSATSVSPAGLSSGALTTTAPPPPLASNRPAVKLEPGTKSLVLARPLDKEGADGEQALVVHVRCRPRTSLAGLAARARSTSSSSSSWTSIPIRIIVTDANDHAPEFLGPLPYVINVSETQAPNSIVARDILALDKDSAGPNSALYYRVLDTSPSSSPSNWSPSAHFAFTNPLEPILWLTSALDYETLATPSFTITISAQDQADGDNSLQTTAQVQVNVLDFDDQNPRFLDEKYTLLMDEQQANLVGQNLRILPRNLRAEDGDRGINAPIFYSFDTQSGLISSSSSPTTTTTTSHLLLNKKQQQDTAGDDRQGGGNDEQNDDDADDTPQVEQYLHLNPTSGELRLIRQWPTHNLNKWSPLTLVVRATQADNRDRYALTTLTITRPPPPPPDTQQARLGKQQQQQQVQPTNAAAASGTHSANNNDANNKLHERGIEFVRTKVLVDVPEDTPVNEKIARVRAIHLDTTSARKQQQQQQHQIQRPINYQLLDDQTDQFAINGLGEILLKRALDFEHRQVYKFRVLATYTKHSDICHVQVNVLNVNDNKPKFTQSQYSIHLSESRLRSNLIALVQANDADLNDTIKYSIVTAPTPPPPSGLLHLHTAAGQNQSSTTSELLHRQHQQQQQQECAKLFEINSLGQLSLKSTVRQLNVSQCQFIVMASDSLGDHSQKHAAHTQQARVSISVAPQILGRSLNFLDSQLLDDSSTSRQFNSRSLIVAPTQSLTKAQFNQTTTGRNKLDDDDSSSSSSLHRLHSSPNVVAASQRSSLATVLSSVQHMMKGAPHFWDTPVSSALLLSVLLAFLVCLLLIVIVSMSVHVYRRQSKLRARRRRPSSGNIGGDAGAGASARAAVAQLRRAHLSAAAAVAAAASLSTRSSPLQTSSNSASTTPIEDAASDSCDSNNNNNKRTTRKQISDGGGGGATFVRSNQLQNLLHAPPMQARGGGGKRSVLTTSDQLPPQVRSGASCGEHSASRPAEKLDELCVSVSACHEAAPQQQQQRQGATYLSGRMFNADAHAKQNPIYGQLCAPDVQLQNNANQSLVSTSSSRRSVACSSLLTDDSSGLTNCGHYSVNGTMNNSKHNNMAATEENKKARITTKQKEANNQVEQQDKSTPAPTSRKQSSVELAIKDLVRRLEAGRDELSPRAGTPTSGANIKSYRRLQLMDSLARRPPSEALLRTTGRQDSELTSGNGGGSLMALVRQSATTNERANQIRWPLGAMPHKIKRLTWDDEPSTSDGNIKGEDCYVSPDIQLDGPISPLGREHHYEHHDNYLFSLASSTEVQQTPVRAHQLSFASAQANNNNNNNTVGNQHNNQNNCLDYTIVQSSQFHADSLASTPASCCVDAVPAQHTNKRQQNFYRQNHHPPAKQAPSTSLPMDDVDVNGGNENDTNQNNDHDDDDDDPLTSQTNATFKLKQNYHDLKLMTTAVL